MYLEHIQSPDDVKKLSLEQLEILAKETRDYLIKSVARTGGHIGVNCGIVELTIALHYVFDSPNNRFIWDVGHQVYVHKMLTGRLDTLISMRQDGGSPGFPCRSEGEHDPLDISHGGTSLSVALGIALANRLQGKQDMPVAVIGDCALGEGMAMEALNQIGYEKPKMLIVVNDNGWGITSNDTALRKYLGSLNVGDDGLNESFFTALGLQYVGPRDGHDIKSMVGAMQKLKNTNGPVVLHVKTVKGLGLPYAAEDITHYHFSFPINVETGAPITEDKGTEKNVFYKPLSLFNASLIGKKIEELAVSDPKVVTITPATIGAAELLGVFRKVPDRTFDVGMAEQHALTLGVGLALEDMKPLVVFQSTFFQRSFDQLVHDVCANDVPLIIILARSGLAGLDHTTHHAPFDLSYLRCVPNLEIYFPRDHKSFNELLEEKVENWVMHPTVLLFPYGTLEMLEPNEEELTILAEDPFSPTNKGIILTTTGRLKSALAIKKELKKKNVEWGILNITRLKPLDEELFGRIMERYARILTMEENVKYGGFGSSVLEFASERRYKPDVVRITLGDMFPEHGTRPYLYKKYGIDEESIIRQMVDRWPNVMK